jgi:DNA-binding GntR family transcriptional regulator
MSENKMGLSQNQKKFIRDIASISDNMSLDEIMERLRYELLKASFIAQYLDDNPGTNKSLTAITKLFEKHLENKNEV